ncbi:MAG: hypothetical protein HY593_00910 [Candidatus Omnitrophica bacterium]|nr:hypothetical protein [Candidatus Omnitrophota bacterium]
MAVGLLLGFSCLLHAAEGSGADETLSVIAEPVRYSFVKGDVEKFRAHHWIKDGYAGGIQEASLDKNLPWDTTLSMEGHGLIDENDAGGKLSLKREGIGRGGGKGLWGFLEGENWVFLNMDYSEFRRYYDGTGGFYRRFGSLAFNETDKELALNIGKFSIETGVVLENLPDVTLRYEREFKDGAKSRLTWTDVKEGSVTRKIGPAWQDIEETVDVFEVKAKGKAAGFDWNGEQRWEFVRTDALREEKSLATTGVAADTKIRRQHQEPESDLITTILGAKRWFFKDKVYFGSDYRFSQIDSREVESIFETDANGVPTNFSNPKQIRDAHADNDYTTHTWVQSLKAILHPFWSLHTKFKAETIKRDGTSTYPADNGGGAPDGTIDQIDVSEIDNKVVRWGEGVSLRFSGLPRTALYTEFEGEQVRNWLSEDRQSKVAGEVFSREVIAHMFRWTGTVGGRTSPWDFLALSAHARRHEDDIRYNNLRHTPQTASGAKSVFVDGQKIDTGEIAARIELRPCRWFRPAFRYQFQNRDYLAWGIPDDANRQESAATAHIYSFDLALQPLDDWLLTAAFSLQDIATKTPARFSSNSAVAAPTFNADVYSWLFGTEYAWRPEVILTGFFQYSRAANFNDFSDVGLPLGVDYKQMDLTAGCRWKVNKDMELEPKYSLYQYYANPDAEYGNYNAHLFWLEMKVRWG